MRIFLNGKRIVLFRAHHTMQLVDLTYHFVRVKCNVMTSSPTCVMCMHVSVYVNNTSCVHVCTVAMVTV